MPAPDYAAEIAALEAAAASGELQVWAEDEKITYRSMKDLLSGLQYFKNQAAAFAAGGSAVPSQTTSTTLATFGEGSCGDGRDRWGVW